MTQIAIALIDSGSIMAILVINVFLLMICSPPFFSNVKKQQDKQLLS